ncbi:hypothetical protein MJO28_011531 [Puccinia striiformis f. sp. tritici]|uniref:Uncharacterized protein n=1 Tax=Puccinia striiformis f. sp. tritici TaxID=168172 RepID=A0ACC0E5F8_9BASI|nr:hypothetical protein MJO28_011531 [Puccinia striiformis f. sp. tritici]
MNHFHNIPTNSSQQPVKLGREWHNNAELSGPYRGVNQPSKGRTRIAHSSFTSGGHHQLGCYPLRDALQSIPRVPGWDPQAAGIQDSPPSRYQS